jgi:hypothetical protein
MMLPDGVRTEATGNILHRFKCADCGKVVTIREDKKQWETFKGNVAAYFLEFVQRGTKHQHNSEESGGTPNE